MIELEFTEGALIEYSSAVSKAVKALKELGVATALDDFGTGYSSMSYLRHFPIDTLKIDRVFVRDIASRNAGNAPLVDAIIAMAKSLGLDDRRRGRGNRGAVAVPAKTATPTRFRGFCSAGRWRSPTWSAGTPIGCTRIELRGERGCSLPGRAARR